MIVRIWRGLTRLRDKNAYREYLNATGMKDYLACRGNRGARLLCRELPQEQRAEFLFISYWESVDAIKEFAGADIETAHYYPEDKKFLLELEPKVRHYEVLSDAQKK
jgi:heme-degrading monooxygenase HmoA